MAKKLPANGKNGLPLGDRPIEERKKIARMGGIASGIQKRKNKLIRETLEELLSLPLKDPNVKKKLKSIGIVSESMTQQTLMALGVMRSAQQGDAKAATWVRDSIGQKEADKLEISKTSAEVISDIENYVDN